MMRRKVIPAITSAKGVQLEIARHNVTRSLTDEECRQYLHVEACPSS